MQLKFESCLGLGRAGRQWRGEVGQPSRPFTESRKRLAGAYSNRDKGPGTNSNRQGQGRTAQAVVCPSQISPSQNCV